MRIFKRTLSLILFTAILVTSLSSCMYTGIRGTSDYVTEDELDKILNSKLPGGKPTVESGDNNYITIEGDGQNLAAAGKSLLSAVSIYASFEVLTSSFFGGTSVETAYSAGSGVIYKLDKTSGDAYVITNYHVVYNHQARTADKISDNINLYLYGMEGSENYAIPATYVGGSMSYDLAVLKIENSAILMESNAIAAELADSNEVAVLDTAIAVGNPESDGISVTVGYVNVDSEYVPISFTTTAGSQSVNLRVMRIDTAVNSGNSGGGLYNSRGELIGIVNAKMTDSENIGYAIPSNIVKNIAENILYYCDGKSTKTPYKCMLGITLEASRSYTEYDTERGVVHKREEVMIKEVSSGAVADGYLAAGDILLSASIDGTEYTINRLFTVIDAMLCARVGSEVMFTVKRDGETKTVTVPITDSALTACN